MRAGVPGLYACMNTSLPSVVPWTHVVQACIVVYYFVNIATALIRALMGWNPKIGLPSLRRPMFAHLMSLMPAASK